MFVKDNSYMLSPSVSAGEAGSYWIDIREVNLDQIPDKTKCDFLIRIVPDMFYHCKLIAIAKLLSPALRDNRPNSGYVWGIKLEIKKFKKSVEIRSIRDMMISVSVPLLDKREVIESFQK